jgi:hypothetical protein
MSVLALVRLVAATAWLACFGALLAAVLRTWDTFDPSYWSHYVKQVLAGPLIGLALATLVLLAARPLARWLARD